MSLFGLGRSFSPYFHFKIAQMNQSSFNRSTRLFSSRGDKEKENCDKNCLPSRELRVGSFFIYELRKISFAIVFLGNRIDSMIEVESHSLTHIFLVSTSLP